MATNAMPMLCRPGKGVKEEAGELATPTQLIASGTKVARGTNLIFLTFLERGTCRTSCEDIAAFAGLLGRV